MSNATYIGVAVFFAILLVVCIAGLIHNYNTKLQYEREVDIYYVYSDRASDAKTKAEYFNQYVEALEKHKLTDGCSALTFCEQPNASVKDMFKVAKSLQLRLNEIALLDEKDTAYQLGMTQMTENEFEYFKDYVFYQKYALNHGAWGLAITP